MNRKIPELELKILGIMWELGTPSKVQDLIDSWGEEPLPGYTTVLKKLQVMEEKGLISHRQKGRAHAYFPLIKKEEVSKSKFASLLSNLFSGNRLEMAAAFIKDAELTSEEILELKKMLNREGEE